MTIFTPNLGCTPLKRYVDTGLLARPFIVAIHNRLLDFTIRPGQIVPVDQIVHLLFGRGRRRIGRHPNS